MQRTVTIPACHPGRNADRSGGAPRRTLALLALAWTAVVLVFWFGLFVSSMRPDVFRPEAADLYGYFLPKLLYASQELGHGRLPLWNPWEYGGLPFLGAAQTAVLYPPLAAAFALLPPAAALHVFMVAHYLLLGAGAFAMLRVLRLGVPGAIFGTLCLSFQPTLMSSHYNPIRIAAFAWVPWMVTALVRTVEGRSLAAALGLGIAGALQVLAGYPEYAVDTAMILAFLLPAAAWRARASAGGRAALRGAGLVAGAAVAAALVSAPQLVAIAEMFATSVRAVQVVPFLAGQQFELAAYGAGLAAWVSSISTFGYLPALGWILVFVGLVAPGRAYRWALLAVWIMASVVYSEPLRAVPPFRYFRSFLPWSTLLYVPLAALAGAGFDRVAAAVAGVRPTRREVAVVLVGIGAALPLLSVRSLAWLAVTVGLLVAGRGGRVLAPTTAVSAALVATLATIWTWVPPTLPQTLPYRYARGEAPFPSLDEAFARIAELRAVCGDDGDGRLLAPLETLRRLPSSPASRRSRGIPSRSRRRARPAPGGRRPRARDPRDARLGPYRAREERARPHGCRLRHSPRGNEEHLARLGFTRGGRLSDGRTAFVRPAGARCARHRDGAPRAERGGRARRGPRPWARPRRGGRRRGGGRRRVRLGRRVRRRPGRDASRPPGTPGRLVFSVATPGRRTRRRREPRARLARRVDGVPAEVLRADYAFMAVPVAAGEHVVELSYRPRGLHGRGRPRARGVALSRRPRSVGGARFLRPSRARPSRARGRRPRGSAPREGARPGGRASARCRASRAPG
jgi:hypothetical protein